MGPRVFYAALLVANITLVVYSSKILVLPFSFPSHINIFTKLGKALHDDGHEVWVLANNNFIKNIEKHGLIPLSYPLAPENDFVKKMGEWMEESPDAEGLFERLMASEYWLAPSRICDSIMQNEHIMSTIWRENFDLAVVDNICFNLCSLMIPYKFDIPFVSVFGFQASAWRLGVTGMPSIEPEVVQPYSNKMNFWQRLDNLHSWLEHYNDEYSDLISDHHMDRYCPTHKPKTSFKELSTKAEISLMNFEIICLDYPRVSAPNIQYLGGSTVAPVEPLGKELEAFVSGADYGIVIMSLGTWRGAQQTWKIIGHKLFKAFGQLPQRIIVQYSLKEMYGEVPPNMKLMKWIPQNDLLGHPKTKLFVMHGGNNGQNEAAYHGVPMLVIPIMFDQIYNGVRVGTRGYGKLVKDKKEITAGELYQMMSDIIGNETYAKNIKKCSAILHSMPTAQEKFVFWVNHVLQFGGAHLRPPSIDMPLYQVLMLDIVAYYVLMALGAFHAVIFLLYFGCKQFFKYHKAKRE